ncbi:hypothetical protein GC167_00380 [bacterium]|nr:hypothetical protein [bacterium]
MDQVDYQSYLKVIKRTDPGRYNLPEAFHQRISQLYGAKTHALSEEGRPLMTWEWGMGSTRVLAWSQMHGNESTGTRALEGVLSILHQSKDVYISKLKERIKLRVLPMINPDGAYRWTRRNALGIDINRDARKQVSTEARFLSKQITEFKPHYSLNLHDQRSLFRLGQSAVPTTLALAIPRLYTINPNAEQGRLRAVHWVERLLTNVNSLKRSSWGLFDESYYPTAFGEWAQEQGSGTVLIESGIKGSDFLRNQSVEELGFVILQLLFSLENAMETAGIETEGVLRLGLQQNQIGLYDWVDRSAAVEWKGNRILTDLGWRYVEKLVSGELVGEALLAEMGDLTGAVSRNEISGRFLRLSPDESPGPGLIRAWEAVSDPNSSFL